MAWKNKWLVWKPSHGLEKPIMAWKNKWLIWKINKPQILF
jgi:hypothetical protein